MFVSHYSNKNISQIKGNKLCSYVHIVNALHLILYEAYTLLESNMLLLVGTLHLLNFITLTFSYAISFSVFSIYHTVFFILYQFCFSVNPLIIAFTAA